jgi:YegS/Rv2252/BmrU family lipid kinase
MANGKFWIILNPTAGKGRATKQRPKIERFMQESGRDFEILLTKGPGDALDIVRNLPLDQQDATIAAGGDGTCNEVVNGLLTRSPTSLPPVFGILPIGRGNDFSYTPGIPEDLEKAMRLIINTEVRPLDVGFIKGGLFPDGRYFLNGVGIGFDTKAGFEAAKMKIKSGISYALGALITVARYEPSPVIQMCYDESEMTLPAAIVSVVNGKRMGGAFFMGPKAELDDGLLDFCTVRHQSGRIKLLKILFQYTKGMQGECEGVYTGKAAHYKLKAREGGMAAHCDGETVCYDGKELEISCVPGALRLIAGKPDLAAGA